MIYISAIFFAGLILTAAVVALGVLRLPWRRGGSGPPSCGRCGYPARGVTTFQCPECGADLREVGIVRPQASNAGWRPPEMLGLLVLLGVLGTCCICSGLFFVARSTTISSRSSATATPPVRRPRGGRFQPVPDPQAPSAETQPAAPDSAP